MVALPWLSDISVGRYIVLALIGTRVFLYSENRHSKWGTLQDWSLLAQPRRLLGDLGEVGGLQGRRCASGDSAAVVGVSHFFCFYLKC